MWLGKADMEYIAAGRCLTFRKNLETNIFVKIRICQNYLELSNTATLSYGVTQLGANQFQ